MERALSSSTDDQLPLLSIIVCVKDDQEAFRATLESLAALPVGSSEVIVSDGSEDRRETEAQINEIKLGLEVRYLWNPPLGVYPAINEGLRCVRGEWVYVLNSGDLLIHASAGSLFCALGESTSDILLFQVSCIRDGTPVFESKADMRSIFWPHQGVFLRHKIHRQLGFYNEGFKVVADQVFLHMARARYSTSVFKEVIAEYDLRGISSGTDLRIRKEFWLVRKMHGVNPLTNFFWSYVRPIIRGLIDRFLSPRIVDAYLKRRYGD